MTSPRTLTRYKAWADRKILDAVADLPEEEALKPRPGVFRNMVHTLNHIYVIDRVFQAHLEGREHGYTARNTRECPALADLRRAQEEIDQWYVDFYDALPAKDLDEVIAFTFIGGGQGAMTRAEILLHLVNHTTYHRGNVASMIYQVPGRSPPTTDLPVYLRDVSHVPQG
jgi:uncharacterized damage-inducible protein DinB